MRVFLPLADLKFGWRLWRKQPIFTAVVLLTLALGIGVNTAVASAVRAILLDPWPYDDAKELIALRGSFENTPTTWVAYRELEAWQERSRAFEEIAGHRLARYSVRLGTRQVPVIGVAASSNLFAMLGVEPLIGRTFTPEEDRFGAGPVVILSYPFWQRRFGGRESVLGESLQIDGEPFEIIGVMPPDVLYPDDFRSLALWLPLGHIADEDWSWSYETHPGLSVTGRLAGGTNLAAARADMKRIAAELAVDQPTTHTGRSVFMKSVLERSFGQLRPRLLTLTGAVFMVLLIACVNVASLLLVRGTGRTRELAIRRSLGASRRRILGQLLMESVALALAGAALGLAVGWATLQGLLRVADIDSLPAFRELSIDGGILSVAVVVGVLAGILAGTAPALAGAKATGTEALIGGTRNSEGYRGSRLRGGLVVTEVALAVVLAICALLSVRSYHHIVTDDPGFDSENLLTFSFSLPSDSFQPAEQAAFFYRMLARLESLPGVSAATTTRPIAAYWSAGFDIAGRPTEDKLSAKAFQVSPGYFATMGMTLQHGRPFLSSDRADSAPVLVVDRRFAETFFSGDDDALGAHLRLTTDPPDSPGREIVGIVDTAYFMGPQQAAEPTFYQPAPQAQEGWGWAVLRTTVAPKTLSSVVAAEMTSLEPDLLLDELWTMEDRLASHHSAQRLAAALLAGFALLAVALAALGIYGVVSYSVASQRREMGIRQALGARSEDIIHLVVRRGLRLTGTGLFLGLAVAAASARLLTSQLHGTTAYDPGVWLTATGTLIAAALVACTLPAWRASRVRPTAALRDDK